MPPADHNPNMNLADKYITMRTFASGDRVQYVCDVGYVSAGGRRSRTCKDGTWTRLPLKCERKNWCISLHSSLCVKLSKCLLHSRAAGRSGIVYTCLLCLLICFPENAVVHVYLAPLFCLFNLRTLACQGLKVEYSSSVSVEIISAQLHGMERRTLNTN